MRILFIENRYRTNIWRYVATNLRKEGHDVKFIIQNRRFHSKNEVENEFVIPYPKTNVGDTKDIRNMDLIKSDRNINYFGHENTGHYDYYREKILNILTAYRPNVVFGESTAFHELITIDLCKSLSISYLHPSSCRYPVGRFCFYKYDTLEPFGGSEKFLSKEKAMEIVHSIVSRKIIPDYMKKRKVTFETKKARLKELITHSLSYLDGEHYNTPSPFIKKKLENRRKKLIAQWNEVALNKSQYSEKSNLVYLLYPLQMQPEANLDVWGRKYRDQYKTVKKLVEVTPDNVRIIVKPNPKSKYELTEKFVSFVEKETKILPIHHNVPMGEVLRETDMVITVTGTIAIECILSNKPVLTLIDTINNEARNCIFIDRIDAISKYITEYQKGEFPRISDNEKYIFLNRLNMTSYKGYPYDSCLNPSNIEDCMKAFRDILHRI